MKNKLLGPAEVREKFGVPPDRLGDLLALMGDSVDNVPGVAGIGPKTAADLISQYGSLDGVLEHVAEIKGKKGQAIASSRDAIEISRKLVRLREDVALGRDVRDLRRAEPDRTRLAELFGDLEFTKLLAQVDGARAAAQAAEAAVAALAPVGTAASEITALAPVGAAAPAITAAPLPPEIILDRSGLDGLCAAIRSAQACGAAVLAEGTPYPRAALVGLAFALPSGARFYLPVGHRLLGGPEMLSATEALAALGTLLASPEIRKYEHDAKVLDMLLRVRGVTLAGLAGDAMLAAYSARCRACAVRLAGSRCREMGQGRCPCAQHGSAAVAPRGRRVRFQLKRSAVPCATKPGPRWPWPATRNRPWNPRASPRSIARSSCRWFPCWHASSAGVSAWTATFSANWATRSPGPSRPSNTRSTQAVGTPFNISSPKQLAEVLFGKLGLPVIRKTKTGPSTDADVLEELATLHPIPAKVVEYRGLTKLKGTYIDALPALVDPRTGRLHTTFNQAVAATGRLSSSDPNLQNIPIRTELGHRIRNAFVADPGFQIVSADYSQIELRVLAHFSQDPAFLDAFASGQDIHRRTAAEVFNVALDAVSSEQRRIAKAINFGLVFGQTDFGLAQTLRIARADAHAYIERYFQRYARVRQYMDEVIAEARRTGAVSTLLGRTRALPQIKSSRPQERNYAERMARNTPIQGSAADLLKLAMIRVDREMVRFPDARLLLTVHDELVFEVKTDEVAAFSAWVKDVMESTYTLRVPLVVDVHAGANWGAAH